MSLLPNGGSLLLIKGRGVKEIWIDFKADCHSIYSNWFIEYNFYFIERNEKLSFLMFMFVETVVQFGNIFFQSHW